MVLLVFPSSHTEQRDIPGIMLNVPISQARHVDSDIAPSAALADPGAQDRHCKEMGGMRKFNNREHVYS